MKTPSHHDPHNSFQLRLRSAIPGRERWQADVLKRKEVLAERVTQAAKQLQGIQDVSTNPITGSILLKFDPALLEDDTETLLRSVLVEVFQSDNGAVHKHSPSAGHPLWRLLRTSQLDPGLVGLALSTAVARIFISFLPALAVADILATVLNRGAPSPSRFLPSQTRPRILALGLFSLGAIVFDVLFEYYEKKLWRTLARSVEQDLRDRTFRHIQTMDMAFIDEQSSSKLLNLVADDTATIHLFVEQGAETLIQKSLTLAASGAFLFALSPPMGVIALGPLVLVVFSSQYFQPLIASRYEDIRKHYGELSQRLSNNLSGIPTVKSFVSEENEVKRIQELSEQLKIDHINAFAASSSSLAVIRLLVGISFTSAFVIGALLTLRGQMDARLFTAMNFVLTRLVRTPVGLDSDIDLYQKALASVERILALLDTHPLIVSGSQRLQPTTVRGEIAFEQVQFSYTADGKVLDDITLHIAPGSQVAIAGATGAGKSTIVKLLLRFYDAEAGRILIDGIDIRDLNIADLRRIIGYVSQDVYLFHGTVYENIIFGRPDASYEDVVKATRIAEAHDFVARLPNGFQTVVGDRGQKLSAGQRQRLSIARVVLKDPPIVVLDEATSSVDNETEAAIQRSLAQFFSDRTVIMIAHRMSTMRNAHCIYVLEKGTIREQGDHASLIQTNGLYASYWNLQAADGRPPPPFHSQTNRVKE